MAASTIKNPSPAPQVLSKEDELLFHPGNKGCELSPDDWDALGLFSAPVSAPPPDPRPAQPRPAPQSPSPSPPASFQDRAQQVGAGGPGGPARGPERAANAPARARVCPQSASVAVERFDMVRRAGVAPVGMMSGSGSGSMGGGGGDAPDSLAGKVAKLALLVLISRVGVYVPIAGVDREAFAAALQGSTSGAAGVLSYVDALTGGSISRVGVFTLGIVPYINASIIFQLLASAFPELKEMQREGPVGRKKFQDYQKYAAVGFALVQAVGQLNYVRPFVDDFSLEWLAGNSLLLTGGAMALVWMADEITKLKLGNGTSILIFVSIVSSLPTSLGQSLQQASEAGGGTSDIGVFFAAFVLTCLGIVYVQEAERKIPINYASQYQSQSGFGLSKSAFLPFKVNATGVMPVIFSSSLLALPASLARFSDSDAVRAAAQALSPSGALYLPFNVALIVLFNYYYTFLQLEPSDVAEQLKRQGASLAGERGRGPGAWARAPRPPARRRPTARPRPPDRAAAPPVTRRDPPGEEDGRLHHGHSRPHVRPRLRVPGRARRGPRRRGGRDGPDRFPGLRGDLGAHPRWRGHRHGPALAGRDHHGPVQAGGGLLQRIGQVDAPSRSESGPGDGPSTTRVVSPFNRATGRAPPHAPHPRPARARGVSRRRTSS